MKLVTFQHPHRREPRLGIVYGEYVIDGNMAYTVLLSEEGEEDPDVLANALLPSNMISFLRRGRRAFEAAERVLFKARSFINM
ncbi:MAG: hypothetical protein QXZ71_03115, partial [Candidatus Caldarchaeum sp.]